jgi:hypothetical protein
MPFILMKGLRGICILGTILDAPLGESGTWATIAKKELNSPQL